MRPIKTMVLQSASSIEDKSYPGVVEANRTAILAFQSAGKIIELPISRGQELLLYQTGMRNGGSQRHRRPALGNFSCSLAAI